MRGDDPPQELLWVDVGAELVVPVDRVGRLEGDLPVDRADKGRFGEEVGPVLERQVLEPEVERWRLVVDPHPVRPGRDVARLVAGQVVEPDVAARFVAGDATDEERSRIAGLSRRRKGADDERRDGGDAELDDARRLNRSDLRPSEYSAREPA